MPPVGQHQCLLLQSHHQGSRCNSPASPMTAALQRGEREAEINSQAVAPAKGCVGEASASESRNTQSCYPGKQQLTEIEEAGGNTARNPSNPSAPLLPPSPYLCLSAHYCTNIAGGKFLPGEAQTSPPFVLQAVCSVNCGCRACYLLKGSWSRTS